MSFSSALLFRWAMCPLEVPDPVTPGHHGESRRQHAENLERLAAVLLVDATEGPGDQGDEGVDDGVDLSIEVIAEMYLAGIINQDGVLDGRLASRSPRIVATSDSSSPG